MTIRSFFILGFVLHFAAVANAAPRAAKGGHARTVANGGNRGHALAGSRAGFANRSGIGQRNSGRIQSGSGRHFASGNSHQSRHFSSNGRHDRDHDRNDHGHDRNWWRHQHHNSRGFVFINGGYFYDPFWYGPSYAYYDSGPYYSYYDRPVYDGRMVEDDLVVEVQRELRRDGYYRGPIDGIAGGGTRGALAAFQRDNRLRVTGRIDRATLEELDLS